MQSPKAQLSKWFQQLATQEKLVLLVFFLHQPLVFIWKRQRSVHQYNIIDWSAKLQIIYWSIGILLALTFLIRNKKTVVAYLSANWILLSFTLWTFATALWSVYTMETLARSTEMLSFILIITLSSSFLSKAGSPNCIIHFLSIWIIWDLLWSLLHLLIIRGLPYPMRVFYAARTTVPLFFFLVWYFQPFRFTTILLSAFTVLSMAYKNYVGIALGLLGLTAGTQTHRKWFWRLLILSPFTIILSLNLHIIPSIWLEEFLVLKDPSGRDFFWGLAWQAFLERPFLGYGFVAGEGQILRAHFPIAISMHNFVFSGLVGTGVIGTILLLLYFVRATLQSTSKFLPLNYRAAFVSTIIMAWVISLTAPGIGGRVSGSWIGVVFIFSCLDQLYHYFSVPHSIHLIDNNENHLGHS